MIITEFKLLNALSQNEQFNTNVNTVRCLTFVYCRAKQPRLLIIAHFRLDAFPTSSTGRSVSGRLMSNSGSNRSPIPVRDAGVCCMVRRKKYSIVHRDDATQNLCTSKSAYILAIFIVPGGSALSKFITPI